MLPKTKFRKLKPMPSYDYCLRHRRNKVFWCEISNRHDLTYDFIREFKDSVDWRCLSSNANLVLTPEFIDEFEDRWSWPYISAYKNLELDDYRRYKDKLHWSNICRNQKMSEEILREFEENLDWQNVSVWQKLSEKFIEDNLDRLNIQNITINQKLSEKFIKKHWNVFKPYINFIARHQKLSAGFIWEHIDSLDIGAMAKNGKIAMNLREKFQYLVKIKAVEEWTDWWHYEKKDPLHKNHNLKNKSVKQVLKIK